jgi:hypothetical protein
MLVAWRHTHVLRIPSFFGQKNCSPKKTPQHAVTKKYQSTALILSNNYRLSLVTATRKNKFKKWWQHCTSYIVQWQHCTSCIVQWQHCTSYIVQWQHSTSYIVQWQLRGGGGLQPGSPPRVRPSLARCWWTFSYPGMLHRVTSSHERFELSQCLFLQSAYLPVLSTYRSIKLATKTHSEWR